MTRDHSNDHWRALDPRAEGMKSLLGMLKGARWLFGAGRGAYIWHATHEANRRLAAGETSGKLEEGRLGTLADLEALGMLEPGGFPLGFCEGRPVSLKTDQHVCVMGMAGLNKTTATSAPAIMRLLKGSASTLAESLLVLDWKAGELTRMAADGVEALTGQPALVFAPFDPESPVRINVLSDLVEAASQDDPIVDAARARLAGFFDQKIASAGQNAWIDKEALSLSHLITVARAHLDPEAATLGGLLDFAQSSLDDITRFMEVASEHREVEGGFVAAGASAFLNRYGPDNERELRWVLQSMAESFGLFARGSRLREATARTTSDVASFKKRPRALFLQTPDRYVDVAAPLILAVLDMLVETLAHAPGPHRVTILAEEFSVLPFSRAVLKWVRVYRSLGIRLAVVVQDRSGFSRFQKEGGHKTFEQNSVKLYFGLSDADHLQHLERRAGRRAVMVPNLSTSLGVQLPGRSSGGAETLTPVLPVSEIARIGAGRALLDIPGQPLFLLDRRPWWEQQDIAPLFRDTRPGAEGGLT